MKGKILVGDQFTQPDVPEHLRAVGMLGPYLCDALLKLQGGELLRPLSVARRG